MEKIFKGSDLVFNIKLEDKNGIPYRVADTASFTIEFYTTDCSKAIKCTYDGLNYKGIKALERIDQIILNDEDLQTLDTGMINYTYELNIKSDLFTDKTYNEIIKGTTEFYLL